MATRYILLPMNGAVLPDASGSGNNAPAPRRRVSTGAQTANTPKATQIVWDFDPATDEHLMWSFLLPGDYVSGGTLRFKVSSAAIAGNTVWKGGIAAIIDSSTSRATVLFAAADVSAATAIPGTANQLIELTIALTLTNVAANRAVTLFIGRDADNASDTINSNDVTLEEATLEYTA